MIVLHSLDYLAMKNAGMTEVRDNELFVCGRKAFVHDGVNQWLEHEKKLHAQREEHARMLREQAASGGPHA